MKTNVREMEDDDPGFDDCRYSNTHRETDRRTVAQWHSDPCFVSFRFTEKTAPVRLPQLLKTDSGYAHTCIDTTHRMINGGTEVVNSIALEDQACAARTLQSLVRVNRTMIHALTLELLVVRMLLRLISDQV